MTKKCVNCDEALLRSGVKYCSNLCQSNERYVAYIKEWRLGLKDGLRGVLAKNISGHIRRYILENRPQKCNICNWAGINTTTGRSPLEIDHIDGDSENNLESNLRLICPNCHAPTSNFRNLNKGKGRKWRRDKYVITSTRHLSSAGRATLL